MLAFASYTVHACFYDRHLAHCAVNEVVTRIQADRQAWCFVL